MAQVLDQTENETVEAPATVEQILSRLESMIDELQLLRQEVRSMVETDSNPAQANGESSRSLADRLSGSLGQGSAEELNYDIDINLYRFSDEPLNQ